MDVRPQTWSESEPLLDHFRQWLEETREQVNAFDADADLDAAEDRGIGLYQLVERLTSLRHEIKLLTKATRGREEQDEATLLSLQAAIEQFRSVQADEARAADRAARPLIEGLLELDDALSRGRRVIENARRRWIATAETHLKQTQDRLEQLYRLQSWWRRAFCRPWHEAAKAIYHERSLGPQREVFDSLLEGYELLQNRLQRTLDEQEIVRMQCVGRQVDPSTMTVVEAVREPGHPPGTVLEEIRTGYYWKRKVFRFAEVKAAGDR